MKTLFLKLSLLLISMTLWSQQVKVEGEVSMLALGDSYTIGESVDTMERWPHQLITELRTLGVSAEYPDYLATTGWTTRNLLNWMLTKLPKEKSYNLVSILIGVNNQYQGMDIGEYEPDLRKIIDLALEIVDQDKSRLMILSIPDYAYTPFGRGNENISEEIDAYNSIKQRVANEYGIAFFYITDISREGLDNPVLVARDGLHPSKEQYTRWVQTIIPRLNIDLSLSAGQQEPMLDKTISLYPNPAGTSVHLDSTENIDRICIYNALGQKVLDLGVKSLPVRIDISALERGAYTLCAYQGDAERIHHRLLLKN